MANPHSEELMEGHPFSRMVGLIVSSKNSRSSAGVFIFFRSLLVSSASATMFGLTAGAMAPDCIGPAFASMCGLGAGFMLGLVHRWRSDAHAAKHALQRYPELMTFHAQQLLNEGTGASTTFESMPEGVAKTGLMITAYYTAAESLSALEKHKEQVLVDKCMAQISAAAEE